MTEALIPVSGFPLSELNVCRLGRDAVLDLSSISAEDEAEEGEDQDDDDDEAAAVGPAAVDTALPLIVEFPVGAHGYLKNKIQLTKDVKACPRHAIPLAFDYESGKVG